VTVEEKQDVEKKVQIRAQIEQKKERRKEERSGKCESEGGKTLAGGENVC
jgi:hypothetical protein